MPTTVAAVLDKLGLSLGGHVQWGKRVPRTESGVYFVSLSQDPNANLGVLKRAPVSVEAVTKWLANVPTFAFGDVIRPPPKRVVDFLGRFWLPDENIIYIGKATSLSKRIGQLVRHKLGRRSPHAGGHWLKALSRIEGLHVYFSECASVDAAETSESAALDLFMAQVTERTKSLLFNPGLPIPFANRQHPRGNRKQNRIRHDVLR